VNRKLPARLAAAIFGLLAGWLCVGCSKSVPVPSDCQAFLDKYFAAVKARDVSQLQELTSYVPHAQSEGMDERGLAFLQESKRKLAADGFAHASQDFGDLQSYSVLSVKETTITTEELAAKKMQGIGLEGIHTEVICKARFSKQHSVLIDLRLFKETSESPYYLEAWRYEALL